MVCLDTSFIIDLFRGKKEAVLIKDKLEKGSESITITSPTIVELVRGINSIHMKEDERNKIDNFINSMTTLALDKISAIKAGEIESGLVKKGEIISLEDIMIASICICNQEKLITKNEKYFKRIKGLEFETY